MSKDAEEKDIYFKFPQSPIQGIPLYSAGKTLDFGFIEIGCKPTNKRKQLKDKKELFYKYWGDEYRKKGVNFLPNITRCLAHYDPNSELYLGYGKSGLDILIFYDYITSEMIENLEEDEIQKIYKLLKAEHKKELFSEVLANKDSELLHNLIVNEKAPEWSYLRGLTAEIFGLKDISSVVVEGMNLYRNGDIRYLNSRYRNGTEIDGILTFYGQEMFIDMISDLRKLDHIRVEDKWH